MTIAPLSKRSFEFEIDSLKKSMNESVQKLESENESLKKRLSLLELEKN